MKTSQDLLTKFVQGASTNRDEVLTEARKALNSDYAEVRRWAGVVVDLLTSEQSEIREVLVSYLPTPTPRIALIRAVREIMGLGLLEAKGIVERSSRLSLHTSSTVTSRRLREIAEELKNCGCTVQLREEDT